jgi:hypothetical protein
MIQPFWFAGETTPIAVKTCDLSGVIVILCDPGLPAAAVCDAENEDDYE